METVIGKKLDCIYRIKAHPRARKLRRQVTDFRIQNHTKP